MASRKKPAAPLGTAQPSAQATRERKETEEIQKEAVLENLTNVPSLPSSGGAVSAPSQRSSKPKEFYFEAVSPQDKLLNINGKVVLRFSGPEEWAQFQRAVRAAT